jgi:hypothetical protein
MTESTEAGEPATLELDSDVRVHFAAGRDEPVAESKA